MAGLAYNSIASVCQTAGKSEYPLCDGNAPQFADWKFRCELRYNSLQLEKDEAIRDTERGKVMTEIIQALRDEALKAARDIGTPHLCKDGGLNQWTNAIHNIAYPRIHQAHTTRSDGAL